jgi:hypothetical protein
VAGSGQSDYRNLNRGKWLTVLVILFVGDTGSSGKAIQDRVPVRAARARDEDSAKTLYEPTARYQSRRIEGWTVLINKDFVLVQAELADKTLTLLRQQLRQVARTVPPRALEKLRTIQIWVEENEPHHKCMAYHPNVDWLRQHGMNPDKARCVEVANARNFLSWVDEQPWMVLHELAHGYHDRDIKGGFDNIEVKRAFDLAMKAKRYRSVARRNGKKEKAYAATNAMEYFAEASEAYFGTNDFYPFVRKELAHHDPEMCALLKKLWRDD